MFEAVLGYSDSFESNAQSAVEAQYTKVTSISAATFGQIYNLTVLSINKNKA